MSKNIRWGILGTGDVAFQFAQDLYKMQHVILYGVASRDSKNAEAFARRFYGLRSYASDEELLKDPSIDVVYIAAPPSKHKDLCIRAFENNKHVLCEKPFALNAAEAKEVIDAARKYNKFCMEAMWMRFIPLMLEVKSLIDAGEIGDVRLIRADLGHSLSSSQNHFRFNPQEGGGALLDLGVYLLSLVCQLMGKPDQILSHMSRGPKGVDEQTTILLHYPNNALAVLTTSITSALSNDCTILGSTGTITINNPLYKPTTMYFRKHTRSFSEEKKWVNENRIGKGKWILDLFPGLKNTIKSLSGSDGNKITQPCTGYGYHYEAAEVMKCLNSNLQESAIMPLSDTLSVLEIVDAIFKQNKVGKRS